MRGHKCFQDDIKYGKHMITNMQTANNGNTWQTVDLCQNLYIHKSLGKTKKRSQWLVLTYVQKTLCFIR